MRKGSAGFPPLDLMAAEAPLVVALNCLEDTSLEQEALAGVATVEHVGSAALADGRIESAAAVILHSLSLLPGPAQRRLRPWQLVLCLGSADRVIDSALAADLGLRLVHVDCSRAEEVADTVMALFLSLLRRTHLLSRPSSASAGWFGSIPPLCRGMRRCRGLVLGIVGRSASASCLATRSLAFKMSVLYFDVHHEVKDKSGRSAIAFPSAARRMDTLNDLLAASDLVSLHCSLSDATMHILDAECLQHIKPGAFIVNTGSSQLIDDRALKQLLINGTIAGCALDGAEGPQWMEAWVREMPNVLILPRSADYSEEVWMEIREKAITILQSFFLDGIVPDYAISDEDEMISGIVCEDEQTKKEVKETQTQQVHGLEQQINESHLTSEYIYKKDNHEFNNSHVSAISENVGSITEGRHSATGKKGKKRPARRRSHQEPDDFSAGESDTSYTSDQDDDTATSGREKVLGSGSRLTSPEDPRNKLMCTSEHTLDSSPKQVAVNAEVKENSVQLLKDGFIIALRARDCQGYHVSRQRNPRGGWFLDTMSNISKRDPAAEFLVCFRSKGIIGLRSLSSGGKLLQINRRMEFVFASHNFDVWEAWTLHGSTLEQCKLVNCKKPSVVLEVSIEILATVNEDGVTRWID
ncbi:C-terminal binding protein AN-like [Curcuma longa]|uniref:C-terminal binding protein AN-like n=1 Tax=Curcuma longa TaxID=136217 RepID=UPI003D9EA976